MSSRKTLLTFLNNQCIFQQSDIYARASSYHDQVGLAAASENGSSSGDGGIGVTTSNPVRISNPINLDGGNFQGQFNGAFGK